MKKMMILSILICLLSSSIQAQDYSEMFDKFKNKELSYDNYTKQELSDYVKWVMNSIYYGYTIEDAPRFEHSSSGYPLVEIEHNENIYTYPAAFVSSNKSDDIIFYNSQVAPQEVGVCMTNVHGSYYPSHIVTMDKVKIGENNANIRSIFCDLYKDDNVELVIPQSYLKLKYYFTDKMLVASKAIYSGEPVVVYTQPKYINFQGQLIEVNSGISQIVPSEEIGHLSLVDTFTMTSKLIPLKGITDVGIKVEKWERFIYLYDHSTYGRDDWNAGKYKHTTISQNQSPIYIAKMEYGRLGSEFALETAIIPKEGDIITDIQAFGEYIYMCGTTSKQGYVGYENGILIILKKTENGFEEVVRYRSKNKDRFYSKIIILDKDNICLLYDNWYPVYQNNGANSSNFDIINIPAMVNK